MRSNPRSRELSKCQPVRGVGSILAAFLRGYTLLASKTIDLGEHKISIDCAITMVHRVAILRTLPYLSVLNSAHSGFRNGSLRGFLLNNMGISTRSLMGIIVQRIQTVVLLLAATTVANLRAQYDMITEYELSDKFILLRPIGLC